MILEGAMRRQKALKVVLEQGGQTEVVALMLPVGLESVEFIRDARPWLASVRAGEDKDDPALEAVATTNADLLEFALKWLPRLCPPLEKATPTAVSRAVVGTGGANSELLAGLARLIAVAATLGATKDEVLQDFPFA